MIGIYGYWDTLKNEMVYIGQAIDIKRRLAAHMKPSEYSRQKFNMALQNDPDRYEVHVLKECTEDELDYWEITLIALYNPKHNHDSGGNVRRGLNSPCYGKPLPQHMKDNLSKLNCGEGNPMYGKHHSLNSKMQMSKSSNNKTGFFRVSRCKDKNYKQGFSYRYSYLENGKRWDIRSNRIIALASKVKARGLPWLILNETLARQTIQNEIGA